MKNYKPEDTHRIVENNCDGCGIFQLHDIPRYSPSDSPEMFKIKCHRCRKMTCYGLFPKIKAHGNNPHSDFSK